MIRRCVRSGVILMLLLFAAATGVQAGVGMLEEDEKSIAFDLSLSASNQQWDSNRNVLTSVCKRRNADFATTYQYGWSYFHTVYASANLAYRRCGNGSYRVPLPGGGSQVVRFSSGRSAGLGDVELGVRTRFSGNYLDTAAWDLFTVIPTGYDNNSASALGRGALGLGLGVQFSSHPAHRYPYKWGFSSRKWGWRAGSKFTYYFSSKGNGLSSFASLQYAFTDSDFETTGDYLTFRIDNSIGFRRGGIQQQVFINQTPNAMTSADQTALQLKYSHSFANGWSGSIGLSRAIFGRNAAKSWGLSGGASYRWRD